MVGKNGGHHPTTDVRRGELGRDDGGQGVVTTDSDAHYEPPNDEDTDDVDRMTGAGESLTEGSHDDEHELDTVYVGGDLARAKQEGGGGGYAHIRLRPTTSASQPKRS